MSPRNSPLSSRPRRTTTAASVDPFYENNNSKNNNKKKNRWLVLDFDGTCTTQDTTSLLPLLASLHSGEDERARHERLETFRALEQEYLEEYARTKETILLCHNHHQHHYKPKRTMMNLQEALATLDDVSTFVTHKVSQSACLKGMPLQATHVAQCMEQCQPHERPQLHEGCATTIVCAANKGWNLGVLSINWCPPLIEATLLLPLRQKRHDVEAEIWSNEVDEAGVVRLCVPGALEKRMQISRLRRREEDSIVVYVGDSYTDLTALLEADIGILIGNSETVLDIAKQWHIRLQRLSDRNRIVADERDSDTDTVWMANDWPEIASLLQTIS